MDQDAVQLPTLVIYLPKDGTFQGTSRGFGKYPCSCQSQGFISDMGVLTNTSSL
jgi:hypothetical protein